MRFPGLVSFQLLFCLCLVGACSSEAPEDRPANLIPKDQMVDLLTDFSLAESASSANVKNVPTSKYDSVYAFNPLDERGIRKSQYDSTLAYYAGHIEAYKAIYEEVLEKLSRLQAQSQSSTEPKASK